MDFHSAIDEFLAHTLAKRGVRNTMLAYRTGVLRFQRFIAETNRGIDADAVIDFAGALNGAVKPGTKANYLIAANLFLHWCVGKRLIEIDLAEMERLDDFLRSATRRDERLPHLPADEVIDVLCRTARAVEVPTGKTKPTTQRLILIRLRDIAMVESLRATGMRAGELVGLQVGDMDRANRTARVMGKGRKPRNVFFDETAWRAVDEYLQARGMLDVDTSPVFARHNIMTTHRQIALPITTDTVRDRFLALLRSGNIDVPLTPHWMRHWFATRVLERTNDLAMTQDMLGHSSPATTRIYAKVSTKRMREAHGKAFG